MKKRSLIVLMMIMMLVVVAMFTMASCGEGDTPTDTPTTPVTPPVTGCQHTFEEWKDLVKPTSTEAGSIVGVCTKCKKDIKFTLPANVGDIYTIEIVKAPTCKEEGIVKYSIKVGATVCSYNDALPKIDHKYSDWHMCKEPTCIEMGEEESICSECNDRRTRTLDIIPHEYLPVYDEVEHWKECKMCHDRIEVSPHKFSEWKVVTPATATTDAIEERVCECGYKETRTAHEYKKEVIAPTCESQGYTVYTCEKCKDTYTADYVDALGHDWGETTYYFDPTGHTCTATRVCNREHCSHHNGKKKEVVYATITAKVTNLPTCTTAGTTEYTASFDVDWAETQTNSVQDIPEGDHNFVLMSDANSHWYECPSCKMVTDKTAHDYEIFSDEESHWMVCKVCGHTTDKIKHPCVNWTVEQPTCTTPGRRYGTCAICGEYVEEIIPALGHDIEYVADGDKHYKVCKRPGCGYKSGIFDHELEWVHDDVEHHQECKICHHIVPDTAKPHDAVYGYSPAGHWLECATCGYHSAVSEHKYGDWIVDIPATCSDLGHKYRECKVCHYREEETIPAEGHHLVYKMGTNGVHYLACDRPGCTYRQEDQPHEMVQMYNDHEHYMECKYCHYREGVTHPHDMVDKVNDGFSWSECSECGYATEQRPHLFGAIVTDKEPTCTEAGHRYKECKHCHHRIEEEIPALGHLYEYIDDGANGHHRRCRRAGCTHVEESVPHTYKVVCDEKQHYKKCIDCGNIIDREAHVFGIWAVRTEPTETTGGVLARYCSCGYEEIHKIPALNMLGYNKTVVKSATCEEEGIEALSITLDGQTLVFERKTSARGHSYTMPEYKADINNMTVTATRRCRTCGKIETETQPLTKEVTLEPTCKKKGTYRLVAKFDAEWARQYASKEQTIPVSNEHKFTINRHDGHNHWVECEVCGLKKDVQPHNRVMYYDGVNHWVGCDVAGCGFKEKISPHTLVTSHDETGHWSECSECGYKSPKVAHAYGKWIVDREPSCDKVGIKHRVCACGQVEEAEIPVLGHDMVYRYDNEKHWKVCAHAGCNETSVATPHTFRHVCTPTEHYDECVVCGAIVNRAPHDFDANGKCKGCDFEKYLMSEVTVSENQKGYVLCGINYMTEVMEVPATYMGKPVYGIARQAFQGNDVVKSVKIPKSVVWIEKNTFVDCIRLEKVIIEDIKAWCNIVFEESANPLTMAGALYLNEQLLTELVIPEGTTYISQYAFKGATSITKVTIPKGSVEMIGKSAFEGCTALTSVTIGEGVTTIDTRAFAGCTALTSVNIPQSVMDMGINVFVDCANAVVTADATKPPEGWNKHALDGVKQVIFK